MCLIWGTIRLSCKRRFKADLILSPSHVSTRQHLSGKKTRLKHRIDWNNNSIDLECSCSLVSECPSVRGNKNQFSFPFLHQILLFQEAAIQYLARITVRPMTVNFQLFLRSVCHSCLVRGLFLFRGDALRKKTNTTSTCWAILVLIVCCSKERARGSVVKHKFSQIRHFESLSGSGLNLWSNVRQPLRHLWGIKTPRHVKCRSPGFDDYIIWFG